MLIKTKLCSCLPRINGNIIIGQCQKFSLQDLMESIRQFAPTGGFWTLGILSLAYWWTA